MSDYRYNYGHPYNAWGPMWPFIAPWMQAMQAWTCAMAAFAPGAAPHNPCDPYPPPQRPCDPYPAYGAPGCATSPRVSVKVSSQYRTEVSACVDPGADACQLTADSLTTNDDTAPPLKGVAIDTESGHVRVRVTVPNDQPVGRYSGAIRDTTGCKRGELTVEIAK